MWKQLLHEFFLACCRTIDWIPLFHGRCPLQYSGIHSCLQACRRRPNCHEARLADRASGPEEYTGTSRSTPGLYNRLRFQMQLCTCKCSWMLTSCHSARLPTEKYRLQYQTRLGPICGGRRFFLHICLFSRVLFVPLSFTTVCTSLQWRACAGDVLAFWTFLSKMNPWCHLMWPWFLTLQVLPTGTNII